MATSNDNKVIYIDQDGLHVKDYPAIHDMLTSAAKRIFGQDVYVDPDSMDGQHIAIFADAIYEAAQAVEYAYNSFSPSTSTGDALSRNVKINGISRKPATFSTVDVTISGVIGTIIKNGVVGDVHNQKWALPPEVVIPQAAQITVTATATAYNYQTVTVGQVNRILTPTRGWSAVNNYSAPIMGATYETDPKLRARQTKSTAIPSRTVLDGIEGAILDLEGVTRCKGYENDTSEEDDNGLPPHSIALVVDGGSVQDIGEIIGVKKTEGCYTHGDINYVFYDRHGIPYTIRFFRPEIVPIFVKVSIRARSNYTAEVGKLVQQAISDYINSLAIGAPVVLSKLYVPANLACGQFGDSYEIEKLQIGLTDDGVSNSDIFLAFNQAAFNNKDLNINFEVI